MKTPKPKYEILTWDIDRQDFTPQQGVRRGPYTLFGLRKAIRALRECGYTVSRHGDSFTLIQRI